MVTDLGVVSLGRDGKLWRKPLGKSKKTEKTWRTLGQLGKTMGKPPFWKVFDKEIHDMCAFFAGTCF